MYEYIKGTVEETYHNSIVIENNQIGYLIYTARPYSFTIGEAYKIHLYQYVREEEITLYGFQSKEEKNLFLKLIAVKGLGCKMALPILASEVSSVVDAIERENILYLKKFPKIGDKVARQIILDLKGKLVSKDDCKENIDSFSELAEALKGLGYKPGDIKKILPMIQKDHTIEEQIRDALKLLLK